jgi:hypothetical protein
MKKYNRANKSFKLLLLVFVILIFSGCGMDYSNSLLSVENKSKLNISILYNNGEYEKDGNLVAYYIAEHNTIEPDSLRPIFRPGRESEWHDYIQEGKHKKLFIYVFEVDSLKKHNSSIRISQVLDAHEYLKKLEFTEEQLIKSNWKITFKY